MPLTDTKIRQAKPGAKPIKMADSNGLYLQIQPNGSKLWRYRYRIGGKENVFAIGSYPELSLAEARAERDRARALVKRGIHPLHERKVQLAKQLAENADTVEAVARDWLESKRSTWADKTYAEVRRVFEAEVFPAIGVLPIRQVQSNPQLILSILEKIHRRGAEVVAVQLRQHLSAMFRYAIAKLRADIDPAAALKGAIIRPRVQHRTTLGRADIPVFLQKVDASGSRRPTKIALRLLLYLFPRPSELRLSEWPEWDLQAAEWRIPAERMKMGDPHIVPLPRQAIALLDELHELTGHLPVLFPNMKDRHRPMSGSTLNAALAAMGYGAGELSAHGFRGTASTILHELGFEPLAIERQLAHQERNQVKKAYNHAQFLPERRRMMQAWADFVDGLAAGQNVVPLHRSGPAA